MAKAKRTRLDQLLVERGLAPSRSRAQSLILSGNVLVDDAPETKAGTLVSKEAQVRLRAQDHPYVSRGGLKLAGALDAFQVDVSGQVALDVGASTGGFTDVLLARGAKKVFAFDVGHGQLDWKIRTDPRVVVREGLNARYLTYEDVGEKVNLVVIDVSFISLEKVLPALICVLSDEAVLISLIKPQFEVGKDRVGKGGIVSSEEDRTAVIERLTLFCKSIGLTREGLIESPIMGTDGNKEFLALWKRRN